MISWISGRLSRRKYWTFMGAIIFASALVAIGRWPYAGLLLTAAWIMVAAGRLHDLGRSGWWAAGLVAFNTGAVAAGELASPLMTPPMVFVGSLLMLSVTLWLGVAESDPLENRFGAPPARGKDSTVAA